MIAFGSDYRTAPGHVEPGTSAQQLLDGGRVGVAIAAAGTRSQLDGAIRSIAVPLAGPHNDVARETAAALSEKLGSTVVESSSESRRPDRGRLAAGCAGRPDRDRRRCSS